MRMYCMNCKTIVEALEVGEYLVSKHHPMYRGKCSKCRHYCFKRIETEGKPLSEVAKEIKIRRKKNLRFDKKIKSRKRSRDLIRRARRRGR